MPWYTITWFDITEIPVKREVLYRYEGSQAAEFCARRMLHINAKAPEGACGYRIRESTEDEYTDWDYSFDGERVYFKGGMRAVEIDIPDEELAKVKKAAVVEQFADELAEYRAKVEADWNKT